MDQSSHVQWRVVAERFEAHSAKKLGISKTFSAEMASGSAKSRGKQSGQSISAPRGRSSRKRKQDDHIQSGDIQSDSEDIAVSPEIKRTLQASSKKRKQVGPYEDLPRPTQAECQVLLQPVAW